MKGLSIFFSFLVAILAASNSGCYAAAVGAANSEPIGSWAVLTPEDTAQYHAFVEEQEKSVLGRETIDLPTFPEAAVLTFSRDVCTKQRGMLILVSEAPVSNVKAWYAESLEGEKTVVENENTIFVVHHSEGAQNSPAPEQSIQVRAIGAPLISLLSSYNTIVQVSFIPKNCRPDT